MNKEEILILILILAFCFLALIYIIIKGINRNLNTLKTNKQYLPDQKDFVKVIKIEEVEIPQKFYSYIYSFIITFKSIDTGKVFDLYVEEYDAKLFDIDEEYHINHDGVVLFEYRKSF